MVGIKSAIGTPSHGFLGFLINVAQQLPVRAGDGGFVGERSLGEVFRYEWVESIRVVETLARQAGGLSHFGGSFFGKVFIGQCHQLGP